MHGIPQARLIILLSIFMALGQCGFCQNAALQADPLEIVSGPATELVTPQQRQPVMNLLTQASEKLNYHWGGSPPFKMEISFTVAGTVPQQEQHGTMEEIWMTAAEWRWISSLGDSSIVRGVNGQKTYGAGEYIPLPISMVRHAVFFPVNADLPTSTIRTATVNYQGADVTCLLVGSAGPRPNPRLWGEKEYCVDPASGLLRLWSEAPGIQVTYDYNGGLSFHGRILPREISVVENGKPAMKIQLDTMADASADDSAAIQQTAAQLGQDEAFFIGAVEHFPLRVDLDGPQSSAIAAMVFVHASISHLGKVVEAEALQSRDPQMSAAAIEAVKKTAFPSAKGQREAFVNVQLYRKPSVAANAAQASGTNLDNARQQPLRCQSFTGPDAPAHNIAAAEEEAKTTPPGPCFATYLTNAAPLYRSAGPGEPLQPSPANDQLVALARSALANAETAWGQDDERLLSFMAALENQLIGRYDIGELDQLYERMLAISEKAYGADSARFAQMLQGIANGYELDTGERATHCSAPASPDQCTAMRQQGYQKAEPFALRAENIFENLANQPGPRQMQAKKDFQSDLGFLANLQIFENKFADAEATQQKETAVVADIYGPSSVQVVNAWTGLGSLYLQQKDYTQANAYFQLALGIAKQLPPATGEDIIVFTNVLDRLAGLSFEEENTDESRAYLQQARDALEQAAASATSATDIREIAMAFNPIAASYGGQRMYDDAQVLYLQAISLEEKHLSDSGMGARYIITLRNYADLLRRMNQPDEAAEIDAKLNAFKDKSAQQQSGPPASVASPQQ